MNDEFFEKIRIIFRNLGPEVISEFKERILGSLKINSTTELLLDYLLSVNINKLATYLLNNEIYDKKIAIQLTPLDRLEKNNIKFIKLFFNNKASLSKKIYDIQIPIKATLGRDKFEIIKFLYKLGANANTKDIYGQACLHRASFKGDLQCVKFLVESSANIDEQSIDYSTCLHKASGQGHLEIVKYLISVKADVNAIDAYGRNCLHIGSRQLDFEIVKLLFNSKIDLNKCDFEDKTYIYLACKSSDSRAKSSVVKYLFCNSDFITKQDVVGLKTYKNNPYHQDLLAIYREFFIDCYAEFKVKVVIPILISINKLKSMKLILLPPKPIIKIMLDLVQQDFMLTKIEKKFPLECSGNEKANQFSMSLFSYIFTNIIYPSGIISPKDTSELWQNPMNDFAKLLYGEISDND